VLRTDHPRAWVGRRARMTRRPPRAAAIRTLGAITVFPAPFAVVLRRLEVATPGHAWSRHLGCRFPPDVVAWWSMGAAVRWRVTGFEAVGASRLVSGRFLVTYDGLSYVCSECRPFSFRPALPCGGRRWCSFWMLRGSLSVLVPWAILGRRGGVVGHRSSFCRSAGAVRVGLASCCSAGRLIPACGGPGCRRAAAPAGRPQPSFFAPRGMSRLDYRAHTSRTALDPSLGAWHVRVAVRAPRCPVVELSRTHSCICSCQALGRVSRLRTDAWSSAVHRLLCC